MGAVWKKTPHLTYHFFLIPVYKNPSFLTNSEFMVVGKVKLCVLHLVSWRKPHSYIQGSDGCHLYGQAFMKRYDVHLHFSKKV